MSECGCECKMCDDEECMTREWVCDNCGSSVCDEGDLTEWENQKLCEECYNELTFCCERCGGTFDSDEMNEFNDQFYCEDCIDEVSFICESCGERCDRSERIHVFGCDYCEDCYHENFTECCECGHIVSQEDAYYSDGDSYCEQCYNEESDGLYSHGDGPSLRFYTTDLEKASEEIMGFHLKEFFGIELEIDDTDNECDRSSCLEKIKGIDDYFYCQDDGSLTHGIEITTQPATFNYHMGIEWTGLCNECTKEGFKSHDTSTCGLHIHISRQAFGDTIEQQEERITKLLFIIDKFWSQVKKFSRRTNNQIEHWADRYGLDYTHHTPGENYETAKQINRSNRFVCVNLQNLSTVEIRIFRGTLNAETIKATLQLCKLLVDLTRLPIDQIFFLRWSDLVKHGDQYDDLQSYLIRRGICV